MKDWVGYKWLSAKYAVEPVQPFRIDSQITRARATEREDGYVHEYYPSHFKPDDTLAGHMTFAFKREGIHLEFLSRLFQKIPVAELESWIESEPTGQYARRAGFFYEWLTGRKLSFGGVGVGNYIDALDEDQYLTATQPENNPRWRVRDNLPGTPDYCPLIYRTNAIRTAETYNCTEHLHALESEYGEDLLMRSAVWITIKESLASFAIERESQHIDRVKRFAAAMERRCGHYDNPLTEHSLAELQSEILGKQSTQQFFGFRKSPVFVGEVTSSFIPAVHYIAPHWSIVPGLLDGLHAFDNRTNGRSSIIRAAVLSFGFVYIHPLADGNGRVSRFLVNDVLRRDGAVPAPFILPVSATITSTSTNRRGYDQVLETFSKPLLQHYQDQYKFGPEKVAEDGIRYNIEFDAYDDAIQAWRYQDLTSHAEYLAIVIDLTIDQEMRKEAGYLRQHRTARNSIKEIIEGPDSDIDRIIRSVQENGGNISNKIRKNFPLLEDPEIAREITRVIQASFNPEVDEEKQQHNDGPD